MPDHETRRPATTFQDLVVWQKSHRLVLEVYETTKGFPRAEMYGLTSQIRRAAVSVPANIAEAFKKPTTPDKLRILSIAQGSLEEVRYYLILANDLEYANTTNLSQSLAEVSRLLEAYCAAIRRSR